MIWRIEGRVNGSSVIGFLGHRVRRQRAVRLRSAHCSIAGFRRLALVSTLAIGFVAIASTDDAQAHHGAYHWHQHTLDWSSIVEVWPHSACSTGCNTLKAEIWKTSAWYGATCSSGAGTCNDVYGPHRTYSFPVTVSTRHNAVADPNHSGGTQLNVYYP